MSAKTIADNSSSPSRLGPEAAIAAPLLEISNAMVRLYKDAFGRGPTKARAMLAGTDVVLVVLGDGFTAVVASQNCCKCAAGAVVATA